MEYYVLEGEINTYQGSRAILPRACILPEHLEEFMDDLYNLLSKIGYSYDIQKDIDKIIIYARKDIRNDTLQMSITIRKVISDELPMCYASWDVDQYIRYFKAFENIDRQLLSAIT